jgi:hypothetical protein
MTPAPWRQLRALTAEAVRDASRRRIVALMAVLSLLGLLFVDSCTSCGSGTVVVNGREVDAAGVLGFTGILLYGLLLLWTVALAGLLASDHLAQPLGDGTARMVLARPVGRTTFAMSRLLGSLLISLGTGALLLGVTAVFLHERYGFALGPALWGGGAAALGAITVSALAMTASLRLPRLACFLLALLFVAATAGANLASLGGLELGAAWSAVDAFGPPLGSAAALVASAWSGHGVAASPFEVGVRLALWALFAPALLTTLFRRAEI